MEHISSMRITVKEGLLMSGKNNIKGQRITEPAR